MVSKGTAARLMSESFHPLYRKRFTLTMATMSRKRFEELSEKKITYGKKHQFLVVSEAEETVSLGVRASLFDIDNGGLLLPNVFGEKASVREGIALTIQDNFRITPKGECFFTASKEYKVPERMRNEILQSCYKRARNDRTEAEFPYEAWWASVMAGSRSSSPTPCPSEKKTETTPVQDDGEQRHPPEHYQQHEDVQLIELRRGRPGDGPRNPLTVRVTLKKSATTTTN